MAAVRSGVYCLFFVLSVMRGCAAQLLYDKTAIPTGTAALQTGYSGRRMRSNHEKSYLAECGKVRTKWA